jgi:imidazolonepropionase-like amidohydrolase
MSATHVRCGTLFTGLSPVAATDQTVVFQGSIISHVGPTSSAPVPALGDRVVDHTRHFVMPGLIDVHTHLAYGNAKTEEDIDLYSSLEFRALRGMFFAQRVLAAGYTSLCAPGDAGRVTVAIRDAIEAGLFPGPRVTTSGPYITSRQGLTDFYPTWVGVPETAIGRLVRSRDEAIEEIRRQVKDGVDCIKLAMDGVQRTPSGDLIAAFSQAETTAMVEEAHRLGRKVLAHSRGREATLYCARAGVDLIYHAFEMDDECLDAILRNKCVIGPTLTLMRNWIDFTRPSDGSFAQRKDRDSEGEYARWCENLARARAAGVPMVTGTDSGFAVTPYGEWHAKEIEIFVGNLGYSPGDALMAATSVAAPLLRGGQQLGALVAGRSADLSVFDGNPLVDTSVLQDRKRLKEVYLGGRPAALEVPSYDPRTVSDFSFNHWNDLYTRERVAELAALGRGREMH